MGDDARMTQRTLREIYLKGFEIAVKESNPWTVMTSYNKINGTYTSESRGLVTDILRNEWRFNGTVMTDWFGGKNTPAQVHAGNDLMMPGTTQQYKDIIEAVKNGSLSKADIDANVSRILTLIVNSPRFKKYSYSNKPDLQAHAAVTRESATEGMVLLKNATNTLPINKEVKKIAAYGITSYDFIAGGTGSGDVNRAYTISLTQGLSNAGYLLDEGVKTAYTEYIAAEKEKNKPDKSNPLANFLPRKRMAEMTPDEAALATQVTANDVAIITLGRTSGEFFDRKIADDFLLSNAERKLLEEVCSAYHKAGKKVVVILNIGGAIETASWKELPDAILLAWQAGQEGGNSVADILSGKVNPSGKLAMTFPVNYMDAASSANFPYDYTPDAKAVIGGLTGNIPAHDPVRNLDYTYYEEGIYVGYRYFDTFGKDVSYPFGYGLSYTSFTFEKPTLKVNKDTYVVSVNVKNNGTVPGKEVAELYVAAPKSKELAKPSIELKAFAKTKTLKPGEEQTITLSLSLNDLASFNENISAWVADAGNYDLQIGSSSRDIKQHLTLNVAVRTVTEKVHDVLKPAEKLNLLVK